MDKDSESGFTSKGITHHGSDGGHIHLHGGPHEGVKGVKADAGKLDLSLLQLLGNALSEVCLVMDYGQTKYTRGGFSSVPDATRRYSAAMLRHYFAEANEKYDTGDPFYNTPRGIKFHGKIRHDAQVAVNALFRLECTLREEAEDEELLNQADMYDLSRRTFNPESGYYE